jgi:hypothetical protein
LHIFIQLQFPDLIVLLRCVFLKCFIETGFQISHSAVKL